MCEETSRCVDHNDQFIAKIKAYFYSNVYHDAVFIVGETEIKEFKVAKLLLEMNSEYFQTLFSNKRFNQTRKHVQKEQLKKDTSNNNENETKTSEFKSLDDSDDDNVENTKATTKTNEEKLIPVYYEPDIDETTFDFIIKYCYGMHKELCINEDSVFNLTYASKKYMLDDLNSNVHNILALLKQFYPIIANEDCCKLKRALLVAKQVNLRHNALQKMQTICCSLCSVLCFRVNILLQ